MKKGISLIASAASLSLLRRQNNLIRQHLSATSPILQSSSLIVPRVGNANQTCSSILFRFMTTVNNGVGPKSVHVDVAHELLEAGHHYLDVRTAEEFSDEHVLGALNIPYMFKTDDGMVKNPTFLEQVSKHFEKDAEIVIGCRSGKRSLMAATDLSAAGFYGVTDIAGGINAWIQSGHPTD